MSIWAKEVVVLWLKLTINKENKITAVAICLTNPLKLDPLPRNWDKLWMQIKMMRTMISSKGLTTSEILELSITELKCSICQEYLITKRIKKKGKEESLLISTQKWEKYLKKMPRLNVKWEVRSLCNKILASKTMSLFMSLWLIKLLTWKSIDKLAIKFMCITVNNHQMTRKCC